VIHPDSKSHRVYGCMKCLISRQSRILVPYAEFTGYAWNKRKFSKLQAKKRKRK